jgi:cytochrome c peroxidase
MKQAMSCVIKASVLVLVLGLSACGGGGSTDGGGSSATSATVAASENRLTPMAALGKLIFKDPSLSSTGLQSCASCHDADHAHAPPNNLAVQLGADGVKVGTRVAPSIRYLAYNKAFRFEADGTPTGGFFWDGRAASMAEQAKGPFLNPIEMANADAAAVIASLSLAPYAEAFKAVFGQGIFNDAPAAFEAVALALQAYQKEDTDFAPFSSKYDAVLRGKASLSAAELRGLALFNSNAKGNCAACHPSAMGKDGSLPLFTDFSFDALGVPANWAVPSTLGDLGLCANKTAAIEALSDTGRAALCGKFKVPSLRNVALRKVFFHNGRFTDLRQALTFYVQRDTNPERWYLKADHTPDVDADGVVSKYNDLPEAFRGNVNQTEAPYNRPLGGAPALNGSEIEDLLSFLNTLSDGWTP